MTSIIGEYFFFFSSFQWLLCLHLWPLKGFLSWLSALPRPFNSLCTLLSEIEKYIGHSQVCKAKHKGLKDSVENNFLKPWLSNVKQTLCYTLILDCKELTISNWVSDQTWCYTEVRGVWHKRREGAMWPHRQPDPPWNVSGRASEVRESQTREARLLRRLGVRKQKNQGLQHFFKCKGRTQTGRQPIKWILSIN